jgi:hypothetical protein
MKLRKTQFEKNVNAKSGFADPDRIKYQKEKNQPQDGKNSPWDFRCPQYDQRSSCFVNAGTHYGVGINQPIGHSGNPKSVVDVLPRDRRLVKTMRIDAEG